MQNKAIALHVFSVTAVTAAPVEIIHPELKESVTTGTASLIALRSIPCLPFALLPSKGNYISQAPLHPGFQVGLVNGRSRQETRGREEEKPGHFFLSCCASLAANMSPSWSQLPGSPEWLWHLEASHTTSSTASPA